MLFFEVTRHPDFPHLLPLDIVPGTLTLLDESRHSPPREQVWNLGSTLATWAQNRGLLPSGPLVCRKVPWGAAEPLPAPPTPRPHLMPLYPSHWLGQQPLLFFHLGSHPAPQEGRNSQPFEGLCGEAWAADILLPWILSSSGAHVHGMAGCRS